LLIGELVPKNLALRNPETIACAVAPLMTTLSRVAAPAVWLLEISTKMVFRLLRHKTQPSSTVTEEELKGLIADAEHAGVLESGEHRMISGVLRLGDRPIRGLMTPRTDVDWIDLTDSSDDIAERILKTEHSRVPVGEGSPDALIGVMRTREPLAALATGKPLDIRSYVQTAPVIPDTTDALDALETLRDADVPMALIHDEYGHFEGIVTPADVLEAIAGVFRSDVEGEPQAAPRDDGSWLLAGWMQADEMADQLGITLPSRRSYQTVAGFVLAHLQHLPSIGESFEDAGWRFEVLDLDGRRVDKVLASRLAPRRASFERAS
jgi:putative hemolysin